MMSIYEKEKLVLCHHDIHCGNIISNNEELSLIDLEFSFNNYVYVELGNIICEFYTDYSKEIYEYDKINHEIKIKVLKDYGIKLDLINFAKLEFGIVVSHFYWSLWGILVSKQNKSTDFNYLKFAKMRLSQIKKLLN